MNALLYNLTENRNVCVSILKMTMWLLVQIIWTNVTLIANALLYNLTENRNVCVSILRMTMWLLVQIIWTNVALIANALLYNLTENRNVCVSILRMTMWLLVWIIWSNADLNLCKFHCQTNEHLVNRDKLTIGQMMEPNIKSNKK